MRVLYLHFVFISFPFRFLAINPLGRFSIPRSWRVFSFLCVGAADAFFVPISSSRYDTPPCDPAEDIDLGVSTCLLFLLFFFFVSWFPGLPLFIFIRGFNVSFFALFFYFFSFFFFFVLFFFVFVFPLFCILLWRGVFLDIP